MQPIIEIHKLEQWINLEFMLSLLWTTGPADELSTTDATSINIQQYRNMVRTGTKCCITLIFLCLGLESPDLVDEKKSGNIIILELMMAELKPYNFPGVRFNSIASLIIKQVHIHIFVLCRINSILNTNICIWTPQLLVWLVVAARLIFQVKLYECSN